MGNRGNEGRSDAPDQGADDVEAARAQIEETRAEMSETIDAIKEELTVERISGRMQDTLREVALGKAQHIVEGARTQAQARGAALATMVKQHPREMAALGSGVAGSVALLTVRARKHGSQNSTTGKKTSKGCSDDSNQSGSRGSSTGKGRGMTSSTISTTRARSRDRAQALTKRASGAATRTARQQITDNLQRVAQENLATMTAIVAGAALTVGARVFDTRRTPSRAAKKAGRGPLLVLAAAAPLSVASFALWRLLRRKQESSTGEDLLLAWLNDAYAMETALVRTLQRHAKDAKDHPAIQIRIEQHLEQTRHHADLVKGCIKRLGGGMSSIIAIMRVITGTVRGLSTGPANDELMKNTLADAAAENFEVASYTALVVAAQELGDQETLAVCRQILQEDQEMARWIEDNLPMITREILTAVPAAD